MAEAAKGHPYGRAEISMDRRGDLWSADRSKTSEAAKGRLYGRAEIPMDQRGDLWSPDGRKKKGRPQAAFNV